MRERISGKRSGLKMYAARLGWDSAIYLSEIDTSDPLQARWVAGHLPVEEISMIRALAGDVFGDQAVGEAWLNQPSLATNDRAPVELLGTPGGFEAVENLLLRIRYGVLV